MKRQKVEETEINGILDNMDKPKAFSGYPYPLNDLSDREFEILLYHIFAEKIAHDEFLGKFDHVDLMQGSRERGRDGALTFEGKNVGLIQCKRYKDRLGEAEIIKEIVKFVLYYLEDKTLIHDIHNFTYYFAVSTGFTEKAGNYLADFKNRIGHEPDLKEWTNQVIKKYKSLNHLKYAEKERQLKQVLTSIHIEKIIPEDLDLWIENSPVITKRFFEVKPVVDIDFAEKKFQEFLTVLRPGGDADTAYSIQRLIDHSKPIMRTIVDTIHHTAHIKRSRLIHKLWDLIERHHIIIVTGDPGVGKSALLKNFFMMLPDETPFFAFKAEDFNAPHLDNVSTNIGLRVSFLRLNDSLPSEPYRIVFVDGLEKLLEIQQDAFIQFLYIIKDNPAWELVTTCRSYAVEQIKQNFFFQGDLTPIIYRIPCLSKGESGYVTEKIPVLAPLIENSRLKKLLSVPFYLQQACKVNWQNAMPFGELTEAMLEQVLWESVIEKGSDDRRRCFVDIAVRRARRMCPFVTSGKWPENVLKALVNDEVLKKRAEPRGFAPAHDVFEDWALTRFLDEKFQELETCLTDLFEAIGQEPAIRRSFRFWFAKRLNEDENPYLFIFMTNVLHDNTLPQYWKDEVLTAMLLSQHTERYFTHQTNELLQDNAILLKHIIRLLKTACWEPDEHGLAFSRRMVKDEQNILSTVLLTPSGSGWSSVIKFVYRHREHFGTEDLASIPGLLRDWSLGITNGKPLPEGAREAGLLALHLLENPPERYNPYNQKDLCRVMVKVAQVLMSEISVLVEKFLEDPKRHRTHYFSIFIEPVLEFSDGRAMCQYMPETVVKIALQIWLLPHDNIDNEYHSDIEHHFDLAYHTSDYFPASGMQGPFASLLEFHPQTGLRLILTLCNHAVEGYINSTLVNMRPPQISHPRFEKLVSFHNEEDLLVQLNLTLPDRQMITQWGSQRLWRLYRGTSVGPDVLQSALMALENWLLGQLEANQDISTVFETLLTESNSVAITAVLVSVATAYPGNLGQEVLPLLRIREFYRWDLQRYMYEVQAKELTKLPDYMGAPSDATQELHYGERRTSNARQHRKFYLEHLVFKLQFTPLKNSIFNVLDDFKKALPSPEKQNDEEKTWRIVLNRMDLREKQVEIDQEQERILFIPSEPDPDIQEFQEQDRPAMERQQKAMNLLTWGMTRFKGETSSKNIYSNWQEALEEAQEFSACMQDNPSDVNIRLHSGGSIYVAALCLREYCAELTDEQQLWCATQIVEAVAAEINSFFDEQVRVAVFEFAGLRPAAMVLPLLLPLCEEEEDFEMVRYFIAGSLLHPSREVRMFAIRGAHQYLWDTYPELAKACLEGMIVYAALATQYLHIRANKNFQEHAQQKMEAIHQLRQRIASLQTEPLTHIAGITFQSHRPRELLFALEMVPSEAHDEDYYKLFAMVLDELIQTHLKPRFYRNRDYEFERSFADLFTRFVLCQPTEKALHLFQPVLNVFESCPELTSRILSSCVSMEDHLKTPASIDSFWAIWDMFTEKAFQYLISSSQAKNTVTPSGLNEIIKTLLLAETEWKKEATEWKPLNARPDFVKRVCLEFGHYPVVFGCIVKLFTTIGQNLLPEGLLWLHEAFLRGDRENVFRVSGLTGYLEKLLRKSLFTYGTEICKEAFLRQAVLDLLDALVNSGSYVAYQLRERLIVPIS